MTIISMADSKSENIVTTLSGPQKITTGWIQPAFHSLLPSSFPYYIPSHPTRLLSMKIQWILRHSLLRWSKGDLPSFIINGKMVGSCPTTTPSNITLFLNWHQPKDYKTESFQVLPIRTDVQKQNKWGRFWEEKQYVKVWWRCPKTAVCGVLKQTEYRIGCRLNCVKMASEAPKQIFIMAQRRECKCQLLNKMSLQYQ